MTTQISPFYVAMTGTESKPARCDALMGEVGRCTLYEQRSSSCREFEASWVDGIHNPRCDAARAAHGLPPVDPPLHPGISPDRVA